MSYLRIEYYSNALRRQTAFEMMIPNDFRGNISGELPKRAPTRPMRTLFLLHGYTGKAGNWVSEELAYKHNFAIVMPNAENSFYLNGLSTGHAFQTMVGEELINYVRGTFGLATQREDTCIAGMSMGGFGALHTALAYPDTFGKTAALSSAFIVHGIAHMKPDANDPVANFEYYRECFGDLETVEQRDVNPEVLVKQLKARGATMPEIFLCCGTEDFLLEPNRRMHSFLAGEKVPHEYFESRGSHDMVFWHEYIIKAIDWMFGGK